MKWRQLTWLTVWNTSELTYLVNTLGTGVELGEWKPPQPNSMNLRTFAMDSRTYATSEQPKDGRSEQLYGEQNSILHNASWNWKKANWVWYLKRVYKHILRVKYLEIPPSGHKGNWTFTQKNIKRELHLTGSKKYSKWFAKDVACWRTSRCACRGKRKKDILTSFTRSKWPIRWNERKKKECKFMFYSATSKNYRDITYELRMLLTHLLDHITKLMEDPSGEMRK